MAFSQMAMSSSGTSRAFSRKSGKSPATRRDRMRGCGRRGQKRSPMIASASITPTPKMSAR